MLQFTWHFWFFLDKRMGSIFRFSKLKINLNFTTWLVRQPRQPNCLSVLSISLTHWGRDKMVIIFLMPFSNAFSSIKLYEYHLRFHWGLFLRINNISSLVQIMAWWHIGDKPLSTPIMVSLLTHIWVTRLQWPKVAPRVVRFATNKFQYWLLKGMFIILIDYYLPKFTSLFV